MNTDELPIPAAGPAHTFATGIARGDGRRCAAQHFGAWAIEPKFFRAAADAIRAGTWKPQAFDGDELSGADQDGDVAYTVNDGVAVVCIDGQMTKRGSSFGGCSTVAVRDALRTAASDARVTAVVLHVCSPGGTCAGTGDLADDVNGVRSGKFGAAKPIVAYIADMGCSAAYWVASQCDAIYANSTAVIGSIGTYTILEDNTGQQEQWGVKYRVVSTGPYKGLGADGTVSDVLVADVQREVDELNAVFLSAVNAGRGAKIPSLPIVADGRAYGAAAAKTLGLIDNVLQLDDVIGMLRSQAAQSQSNTLPAGSGRDGLPAPQAGTHAAKSGHSTAADSGGMEISMDAKKRAYLESVGLRADATDEQAQQFYALLTPEKQAAADATENGTDDTTDTGTGDTTDASATTPPANASAGTDKDRLKAIRTACEGDSAFAGDCYLADMTPEQAKVAYDGVKKAKADTADKQAKIDRLEFEKGGQKPVGTAGAATTTTNDPSDATAHEAKAKSEWAANTGGCRTAFIDEPTYIAARKRELAGK